MKPSKPKPITVRPPPALSARLRKLKDRSRRSTSSLVFECLERGFPILEKRYAKAA